MIYSTTGMRKITTTYGFVIPEGECYVDLVRLVDVQHRDNETRLKFAGEGWTDWRPSEQPVSVYYA